MKSRKNLLHEEPAWKKRRREIEKQARKSKLWVVLAIVVVVAVAAVMVTLLIRSSGVQPPKQVKKPKPVHAIARVVDKRIEKENGESRRIITFRIEGFNSDKVVDEKTFDSVQKDDEVIISYHQNRLPSDIDILDWKPYKPKN